MTRWCCCRRRRRKSTNKLSFTAGMEEIRASQRNILGSPSTKITEGGAKSLVKPTPVFIDDDDAACCEKIPIIHPFGPFRLFWDCVVIVALLYTSIEVPYTLTFGVILSIKEFSGMVALGIDLFLLSDIFINFRTAYVDKYDHLHIVASPELIAKRYIKSWFFIDLISSLPLEYIVPIFLGQSSDDNDRTLSEFFKVLRIFRLLRGLKMLRVLRIFKLFSGYGRYLFVRETTIILKCVRCLMAMLITAHYFACFWFLIGSYTQNKGKESWLQIIDSNHEDPSNFTKYSYSLYWAIVTLFTTGYGDIVAYNEEEQWTASLCILIGTCFFAYFIGVLTTLLDEGDRVRSYELERVEEAQLFCAHHRLPRQLSRAIISHVRYYCNYNYVFDNDRIMSSIPTYLQNHINSYLSQSLIELDMFHHLPRPVVGQIALKMTSTSCNSGHTLFRKGDLSRQLFIQRTGRSLLHISPNKIDQKTRILERGDVCGEYSILSGKHRDTVQCLTWSEFYVLDINDLICILRDNFLDPKAFNRAYTQIQMVLRKTLRKATPRKVKFKTDPTEEPDQFVHALSPDITRSTINRAMPSRTNSPLTTFHLRSPQMDDKSDSPPPNFPQLNQTDQAQQPPLPQTTKAHSATPSGRQRNKKSFEFPKLLRMKSLKSLKTQSLMNLRSNASNVTDSEHPHGHKVKPHSHKILRFLNREDSAERHGLVIKKPNAFAMNVERLDTTYHEFEYSDIEESIFHRDLGTATGGNDHGFIEVVDMSLASKPAAKHAAMRHGGGHKGKFGAKRKPIQNPRNARAPKRKMSSFHNGNNNSLKIRFENEAHRHLHTLCSPDMTVMTQSDGKARQYTMQSARSIDITPASRPTQNVEMSGLTDDDADDEFDLDENKMLKQDSLVTRMTYHTQRSSLSTVPIHQYKGSAVTFERSPTCSLNQQYMRQALAQDQMQQHSLTNTEMHGTSKIPKYAPSLDVIRSSENLVDRVQTHKDSEWKECDNLNAHQNDTNHDNEALQLRQGPDRSASPQQCAQDDCVQIDDHYKNNDDAASDSFLYTRNPTN